VRNATRERKTASKMLPETIDKLLPRRMLRFTFRQAGAGSQEAGFMLSFSK
jgi:hypothetical protein